MPALVNPAKDLPLIFQTMRNFAGGEDSFRDPIELDPDQCQKLVNIVVRSKKKARVRPGADALGATQPGGANPVLALAYFDTPALEYVIAGINGSLYTWDGAAWSSALSWTYAPGARLALAQGVDKLFLSDGAAHGQQWDGSTFTDLGDTPTSPPVGATIALWHAGRMWASGVSTADDTVYCSNLLDFGLGAWDRTQKSFRVGAGEGDPIVALASMQQFVMVVLKRSSVWRVVTDPTAVPASYAADQPSDFISDSVGCVGRDAWCKYGNDLFFLSDDGIYTVQRMAAARDQWELGEPISRPIQDFIDRINPNYAHLAAAIRYQEFLFFSAPTDGADHNTETAVYNARLKRWLGVWTGWTPATWAVTVFDGVKALVFGDAAGYVNEWKDREDAGAAQTYLDNAVSYPAKLWTRSFDFGDLEAPKTAFNWISRFNFGEAALRIIALGSDEQLREHARSLLSGGSALDGLDYLGSNTQEGTFTLASDRPTILRGSLRGLPSFGELFLKIESESGYWELRNLSVSARVHPLKVK